MEPKERIIVALDVSEPKDAIQLVRDLSPHVGCFKIGKQFMTAMLRLIISSVSKDRVYQNVEDIRLLFSLLQRNIFWDGKEDDIPNTIAGTTLEIDKIGVKMFNLHASAGREAIKQAVANKGDALALGVTVLTSLGNDDCKEVFGGLPNFVVLRFAQMLREEGADGLICSSQELETLNKNGYGDFTKVVPGIRPKWSVAGDQKRITTPEKAIQAGADYLVIGRAITNPPEKIGSPVDAVKLIVSEIDKAINLPRAGDQS